MEDAFILVKHVYCYCSVAFDGENLNTRDAFFFKKVVNVLFLCLEVTMQHRTCIVSSSREGKLVLMNT